MTVALTPDVTGPVPIESEDAADHTLVDQLRYVLDLALYRAEQFEHRHARKLAPLIAIAGAFSAAITIGLLA